MREFTFQSCFRATYYTAERDHAPPRRAAALGPLDQGVPVAIEEALVDRWVGIAHPGASPLDELIAPQPRGVLFEDPAGGELPQVALARRRLPPVGRARVHELPGPDLRQVRSEGLPLA